jgi:hypothetical protein
MYQISIFDNYSICRQITSDGEFDLTICTVDTKISYRRIIRPEEWNSIVPDFTMVEMFTIINVCVKGDDAYSMKISRNKLENAYSASTTYFIDITFVLKERIKTYMFNIYVPMEEIMCANYLKLLVNDFQMELNVVIDDLERSIDTKFNNFGVVNDALFETDNKVQNKIPPSTSQMEIKSFITGSKEIKLPGTLTHINIDTTHLSLTKNTATINRTRKRNARRVNYSGDRDMGIQHSNKINVAGLANSSKYYTGLFYPKSQPNVPILFESCDIRPLQLLVNLTELNFNHTGQIIQWEPIFCLVRLEKLYMVACNLTNRVLDNIITNSVWKDSIRYFNISENKLVTDRNILKRLKSVKYLIYWNTGIDDNIYGTRK